MFRQMLFCKGEVALYTWVQWLKEQQHLWAPTSEPKQISSERVDADAELAHAMQQVYTSSKRIYNWTMPAHGQNNAGS